MRHFEVQTLVAAELGLEPSKILSVWITEAEKELGLPVPSMWDGGMTNRVGAKCPARYKAAIIAVLQGESQN